MAKNFFLINNKILTAINSQYGTHLVVNQQAFFNEHNEKVIMFITADSVNRGSKRLFRTASAVMSCLFARDLLYTFQGRELESRDDKYERVFTKNDGYSAIEYMKGIYGEAHTLDDEP